MTETEKYKGSVKTGTMNEIIHRLQNDMDSSITYTKEGNIRYWTGKNLFIARPRGVKYWDISIIFGRDLAGSA